MSYVELMLRLSLIIFFMGGLVGCLDSYNADLPLNGSSVRSLDKEDSVLGAALSNDGDELLFWDLKSMYLLSIANPHEPKKRLGSIKVDVFKNCFRTAALLDVMHRIPSSFSQFKASLQKTRQIVQREENLTLLELPHGKLYPLEFLKETVRLASGESLSLLPDEIQAQYDRPSIDVEVSQDRKTWLVVSDSMDAGNPRRFIFWKNRDNQLSSFTIPEDDIGIAAEDISDYSCTLSPTGKWALIEITNNSSPGNMGGVTLEAIATALFTLDKNIYLLVDVEAEKVVLNDASYHWLEKNLLDMESDVVFDEKRRKIYVFDTGKKHALMCYDLP